ncbi:MAG: glycine dehydrogenase subunit 2 [Verrucomicrobiae bacterium]|nr:glycine dehydrogenase subunit 2 [Verrucomicrobiae bacterium]
MNVREPIIFERGGEGLRGYSLPASDSSKRASDLVPQKCLRKTDAELPQVAEIDVVRHFTRLSQLNFSVDTHFYPLGSCTMKYNPKVNDKMAALAGFANIHPLQSAASTQGALQLLWNLEEMLCEIAGMDAFTLQPAAGAHGELTGMLVIRAHHVQQGKMRRKVIVPDSSHGTNPASAHLCGYEVVTVPSAANGEVDFDAFIRALDEDVAAVMLTNPSTHGLFESRILDVAKAAHDKGALLYYDGANLNALCGLARPGDMGFDVVHINTHKTFSTPHGGGGPGAGPVGVKNKLEQFLPLPRLRRDGEQLSWNFDRPQSVGRVRSFFGNFGVLVRAYAYLRAHGFQGLRRNSRAAIINANYIQEKLKSHYDVAFDRPCMHECVLTGERQLRHIDKAALQIAKRILDFGFHAPTVYFPLSVHESIMIEPTETESRRTLDRFIEAMKQIAEEIEKEPQKVLQAPHTTPIRRLDEVRAARELNVKW